MPEMKTDAATLSAEAENFDRISNELRHVIHQVESAGAELAPQWRGQAGDAAQLALARFHDAGQIQVKELGDITGNIQTAGIQYTSADDEHASSMSSQMGF